MTKLNWEKFGPKFGTWATKIKPFFEGGGLDGIYKELKEQSGRGIRIVPDSADVFRCFRATPLTELRVVLVGMCPYHTIGVADGLCMSCSLTNVLQPSLEQFYGALEEEFHEGLCIGCERNPNLEYLAKQGVLLFNAALTTKAGIAGTHQDLWEPFTAFILREIVSVTGVPVVLLGGEAKQFAGCLATHQPIFELSHPASAAHKKTKWSSEGVFKQVNDVMKKTNGEEIFWLLEEAPF